MFNYLKAKKHKGISEIKLEDLGHINIICGKNNSGKTSILEALNTSNKFAIGKKVESEEWLEELFAPKAERYTNPNPNHCKRWFAEYISDAIKKQTIWYSDEYELIFQEIDKSIKNDYYLGNLSSKMFEFDKLLNEFLGLSKYKTILIPPKRNLAYEDQINLAEKSLPNGERIANRLFFLKNQIPTS
jgi:AAA15 family ATPase/GTPase